MSYNLYNCKKRVTSSKLSLLNNRGDASQGTTQQIAISVAQASESLMRKIAADNCEIKCKIQFDGVRNHLN